AGLSLRCRDFHSRQHRARWIFNSSADLCGCLRPRVRRQKKRRDRKIQENESQSPHHPSLTSQLKRGYIAAEFSRSTHCIVNRPSTWGQFERCGNSPPKLGGVPARTREAR